MSQTQLSFEFQNSPDYNLNPFQDPCVLAAQDLDESSNDDNGRKTDFVTLDLQDNTETAGKMSTVSDLAAREAALEKKENELKKREAALENKEDFANEKELNWPHPQYLKLCHHDIEGDVPEDKQSLVSMGYTAWKC